MNGTLDQIKTAVDKLSERFSNPGQSFVAWYLENIFQIPNAELDVYVSDGPNDAGIDAIFFDESNKEVIFLQGKYDESNGNKIVDLEDISKTSESYKNFLEGKLKIGNKKLKSLLREATELLHDESQEWTSKMAFITNGSFSRQVLEQYTGDPQYSLINLKEIEEILKNVKESENIDFEIKYKTDQIFLSVQPTGKVAICTVEAGELAKLYRKFGTKLFWRNVRLGLGSTKAVNNGIQKTLNDPDQRKYFWLFNNGVTILCDNFKNDSEHSALHVANLSIINGAQTTSTIAKELLAARKPDVQVLVKVIEAQNTSEDVVKNIVRYTNKQTATIAQDFISNDPYQKVLAEKFKKFGYFYDYKRGLWESASISEQKKLIRLNIVELAYAVLAFDFRPGEARNDKKIYFEIEDGGHYKMIFDKSRNSEQYLLPYELLAPVKQKIKELNRDYPDRGYGYTTPLLIAIMGNLFNTIVLPILDYQKIFQHKLEERQNLYRELVLAGADTMKVLIREEERQGNRSLDLDNFTKSRQVNDVVLRAEAVVSERDKEALRKIAKSLI